MIANHRPQIQSSISDLELDKYTHRYTGPTQSSRQTSTCACTCTSHLITDAGYTSRKRIILLHN